MKDKNGRILQIGDSVEVPNPKKNDMWNNEFVGTVDGFRDEDVIVCDGDGDCFDIEPNRLAFYDEAETQRIVDGYIKARNN